MYACFLFVCLAVTIAKPNFDIIQACHPYTASRHTVAITGSKLGGLKSSSFTAFVVTKVCLLSQLAVIFYGSAQTFKTTRSDKDSKFNTTVKQMASQFDRQNIPKYLTEQFYERGKYSKISLSNVFAHSLENLEHPQPSIYNYHLNLTIQTSIRVSEGQQLDSQERRYLQMPL